MNQGTKRWRHGIKARLVLLFLLLALATAAVFLFGMQRLLQGGWQSYAKPLVADYVDRLAAELGTPPDPARADALAARLPVAIRIEGPRVQHDTRPQGYAHRDKRRFAPDSDADEGNDWGLSRSTADGHVVHFSLTAVPQNTRPRVFGWITLALLLLLTALAWAAVNRMLRPLRGITAGVEAFGRGDFSQPIAVRRDDELGALATRINTMGNSLRGMLDAKRALLLAISHELRSPLTRARVNAELLDDSPERSSLLRDLGEMRELITTLLESERLAQGHAALQAEAVHLQALVRQAVADAGATVTLRLDETIAPVRADPVRLQLLLRNLLDNGRRHAVGAARPPELFLRTEPDGRIALGLRDHGPGVPPEQLPRLAEAFHRTDSARTRASGGVGLGLHLCRLVAQAHGGELRISNASPGLEVAMVWRAAAH